MVEIGKIEIIVNDKTFKLTLEEANELRNVLNSICPDEESDDIAKLQRDNLRDIPYWPPWTYMKPYRINPYWEVTYFSTTTDSGTLKLESKNDAT